MDAAELVEVERDVDTEPDDVHWICCLPDSMTALCGVVVDQDGQDAAPTCGTCNELDERDWQLPTLANGRCALCPHNVLGGAP